MFGGTGWLYLGLFHGQCENPGRDARFNEMREALGLATSMSLMTSDIVKRFFKSDTRSKQLECFS